MQQSKGASTCFVIAEAGVAPDSKLEHQKPTMFEKLGGKAAIEAVVDMFYTRVFADEEVSRFFEGINKQRLKAHQVHLPCYLHLDMFCAASQSVAVFWHRTVS